MLPIDFVSSSVSEFSSSFPIAAGSSNTGGSNDGLGSVGKWKFSIVDNKSSAIPEMVEYLLYGFVCKHLRFDV